MGVLEVLSDPSWDPVEDLRRSYEGSGAAEEVSSTLVEKSMKNLYFRSNDDLLIF